MCHIVFLVYIFTIFFTVTSQPPMAPQIAEIPRSTFQFDFDFERKILADAEKGGQNWSRIAAEVQPTKTAASTSSSVCSFFAALSIKQDLAACYF